MYTYIIIGPNATITIRALDSSIATEITDIYANAEDRARSGTLGRICHAVWLKLMAEVLSIPLHTDIYSSLTSGNSDDRYSSTENSTKSKTKASNKKSDPMSNIYALVHQGGESVRPPLSLGSLLLCGAHGVSLGALGALDYWCNVIEAEVKDMVVSKHRAHLAHMQRIADGIDVIINDELLI